MQETIEVNGLRVTATLRNEDVRGIFVPLLRHWTWLWQQGRGRRVVVLLSAPPGAGKTTLSLLLEQLSRTTEGCEPVQALGMDGFHYPNKVLRERGLLSRKGAPDTFDTAALLDALASLDEEEPPAWPAYSRQLHERILDAIPIWGNIVLVEGNYFQLGEGPWGLMRSLANETMMVTARASLLRGRLVARKVAGGTDGATATAWYKKVDRPNIDLVLHHSVPAMVNLHLDVVDGRSCYRMG